MTFEQDPDAYDPLVAEQFELLDHLTVPSAPNGDAVIGATEAVPLQTAPSRRRGYVLASAAAVLVVAGLSVVAATQRDSNSELAATESEQTDQSTDSSTSADSDVTAETSPDAEPTAPLTVDGDDSDSDNLGSDNLDSDSQDGDNEDSTTTSLGEAEAPTANGEPSTTIPEDDQPSLSESTDTTTQTQTTTPSTIDQETLEPTTSSMLPHTNRSTLPPTTLPTTTTPVVDGDVTTISGLVTEVFTDCQSRRVLNDAGEVENVGPVSCDGGSYIVVGGSRIQTSAGYVAADAYWDRHPAFLSPGQSAVVVALAHSSGRLDLSCNQCSVRLG